MNNIAFDTETHLIGIENIAPPLVCLTWSSGNGADGTAGLAAVADQGGNDVNNIIDKILDPELDDYQRIGHNIAYDLGVILNHRPDQVTNIFNLLESGHIHCTKIREKLLNLAQTGNLNLDPLANRPIKYSLAALVEGYFGAQMEGKEGDDIWRLNYHTLADTPSSEWPEAAVTYAKDDAVWTLRVWEAQEKRKDEFLAQTGIDPFECLTFRCMVDFALFLVTCWGMATDAEEKEKVEDMLAEALSLEKVAILYKHKILTPATPPRPQKAKNHVEGCEKSWKEDGVTVKCDCPFKMTKGTNEKQSTNNLRAYASHLAQVHDEIELVMTAPSDKFPKGQISVNADWLEQYAHLDPVLAALKNRNKVQKIVTTELPRMCLKDEGGEVILDGNDRGVISPIVRFPYDSIKETGRSSSRAGKLYPSANGQNIDPRVKKCYRARPGRCLVSVDLSGMELGTLAQKCLNLFGHSVLADKINAGVDAHAYLGSQIAYHLDEDFRAVCDETEVFEKDDVYDLFAQMKDSSLWEEKHHKMYAKYRKLAKPTGLGFPGGLSDKTMVSYAAGSPYYVTITREVAKRLKEIWFETYPEMTKYFEWINTDCIDPRNTHKDGGELYAYSSPFGLYRAGALYCAACNGAGLQSFSADGALLGMYRVVRASFDPTTGSILCGMDDYGPVARAVNFIHDENLVEIADDDKVDERAWEIGNIMTAAMMCVTPNVLSKYEAVAMRKWDKEAKATYDDNGRLIVTEN
jgi:DNA polymerase I